MKMLVDHLKGIPSVARWVAATVTQTQRSFWLYFTMAASWIEKLSKRFEFHLRLAWFVAVTWPMRLANRLLAPKRDSGKALEDLPVLARFACNMVVVWPVLLVRYCLIAAVVVLWLTHGPRSFHSLLSSAERIETPNTKRTPKKSRPWQRLDDFRDVRARIRELSYPKQ